MSAPHGTGSADIGDQSRAIPGEGKCLKVANFQPSVLLELSEYPPDEKQTFQRLRMPDIRSGIAARLQALTAQPNSNISMNDDSLIEQIVQAAHGC